jgi:hypothetical protein
MRQRLIERNVPAEDLPPAPDVDRQWQWIWRAWHRLSDERPQYGGGMGPLIPGNIPWSLVYRWAEAHGMTRGEMVFLDFCIQRMDRTFHKWWVSKQPHAQKNPLRREA